MHVGFCAFPFEIAALLMNKLTGQKYMTKALLHIFTFLKKSQALFISRMASQFISISCRAE